MNSKEIEFLINRWEGLASDYRELADKFKVMGPEVLGVEFNTIASTLEICADDLKNKYAMGRV